MADSTRQSDEILGGARRSLAVQREGGFHRRPRSIGRGSREIRSRHLLKKLKRIVLVIAGLVFAAMIAGLILDGIGVIGVMLTAVALDRERALRFAEDRVRLPGAVGHQPSTLSSSDSPTSRWAFAWPSARAM